MQDVITINGITFSGGEPIAEYDVWSATIGPYRATLLYNRNSGRYNLELHGSGLMPLGGTNPESLVQEALEWVQPIDLGSLDPVDVGFDLRAHRAEIEIPRGGMITIRTARSPRHPAGITITDNCWGVAARLRGYGYRARVAEAEPATAAG